MMDALQRAVPVPQHEIVVHRGLGRQVLGQRAPLAAGAEQVHHAVDHLADIDAPFAAAGLARRDQRLDQRPLLIGQVARIAPMQCEMSAAATVEAETSIIVGFFSPSFRNASSTATHFCASTRHAVTRPSGMPSSWLARWAAIAALSSFLPNTICRCSLGKSTLVGNSVEFGSYDLVVSLSLIHI